MPGNQVLVGGQSIGTINDIRLTDDAQAEVEITVDEPLHEGTTAMVRATSLSGVANRYISIAPGPDSEPELPDDGADRRRPDDLAGRPRPALQHPRREDAHRAPGRDQGPGDDLHRQQRGRPQDLQVLRARPPGDPAAARRADQRPAVAEPLPGRGSTPPWARSPAPRRPLGADPERQRGARRDRRPQRGARPLARRPAARAAPGEHDVREPARGARRPRPADLRPRRGGAASLPSFLRKTDARSPTRASPSSATSAPCSPSPAPTTTSTTRSSACPAASARPAAR